MAKIFGDGEPSSPMVSAIKKAYLAGEEDESLEPIIATDSLGNPVGRLVDGDSVIFYDIRGEREIEITRSLTEDGFSPFPRKKGMRLHFVTMIDYDSGLKVLTAFPSEGRIKNTLSEVLCRSSVRQVKIAESEKAVHIGFFFNGKTEEVFPGEEKIIVPSPAGISSYALKPEMSADLVGREILKKLSDPDFRVIMANLANVDVVGHVDDKAAVLRAVEAVDREIGRLVRECRARRAALIVTSDHGTVEEWLYPDGLVNTGHTKNPVPFVLADFSGDDPGAVVLRGEGELADVAPTVLELLGIGKPAEMTGESLLLRHCPSLGPRNKVVLLVLDGWGVREERCGNLIAEAATPHFDDLWRNFPRAVLQAAGEAVGMPEGTVGNSESGHLHLGAGRRVMLDRVRIDRAIEDGSFFRNEAFLRAMDKARRRRKALHLMGIVSHYSSHGTIKHLFALLRLAKDSGMERVHIHAFIGRRGEKYESGAIYVGKVEKACRDLSLGRVVTVMGRHWALDREENWDRVEKAYRALVFGDGRRVQV